MQLFGTTVRKLKEVFGSAEIHRTRTRIELLLLPISSPGLSFAAEAFPQGLVWYFFFHI